MTDPLVTAMLLALTESISELQSRVTDVRYGPIIGDAGTILFEVAGITYQAPEPTEAVIGLSPERDQRLALRTLLDCKATAV